MANGLCITEDNKGYIGGKEIAFVGDIPEIPDYQQSPRILFLVANQPNDSVDYSYQRLKEILVDRDDLDYDDVVILYDAPYISSFSMNSKVWCRYTSYDNNDFLYFRGTTTDGKWQVNMHLEDNEPTCDMTATFSPTQQLIVDGNYLQDLDDGRDFDFWKEAFDNDWVTFTLSPSLWGIDSNYYDEGSIVYLRKCGVGSIGNNKKKYSYSGFFLPSNGAYPYELYLTTTESNNTFAINYGHARFD